MPRRPVPVPMHWPPLHALRVRQRLQRGAALLLAMLTVALIASLAAGMVWQQHRAIQVEAAERARTQAGWILLGALDWSRLILREDARSGRVDHGGEPWATPLAEARLSTFLAAERGVAVAAQDDLEAFLSGSITDAQARYNLRNLVANNGKLATAERETLERLCAAAGTPSDLADRLARAVQAAWSGDSGASAGGGSSGRGTSSPLPVRRFEHLAWLGFDAGTLAALRPFVDILPMPTPVNVNTASREVLAAVLGIDGGAAERIVQRRQRQAFESLDKLLPLLPPDTQLDPQRVGVSTQHFEVSGRLRLDARVLEERSLVVRRGVGRAADVITLHRERRSSQLPQS